MVWTWTQHRDTFAFNVTAGERSPIRNFDHDFITTPENTDLYLRSGRLWNFIGS